VKARLLSNVTIQPLTAYLNPLDVSVGEFTSLILELADPHSIAASDGISHVLCLYDTDSLLGDAFYDASAPSQADSFLAALDAFCAAHPEKVVVANTFCAGTARALNFAEIVLDGSLKTLESSLNARLVELGRAHTNLLLLDLELIFRRYGEDALISPAFWYAGRIRWTPLMFRALADALRQALAAYGNKARKVLVLDLDNTLWGGIVGDLGPSGVELSEDGRGAIFRDFQRALKALKSTGVLLAICSKNNAADVDELFEKNAMMVLKPDDFAAIRANWDSKPENILDIARTLDLGLDSFVFVDDNPVEREIVSAALPDVAVPGFPDRIEMLQRWFVQEVVRPYFGKYRITSEDLTKTEQYRANEARRQFAQGFDIDRFLDELDIVCTFSVDNPETIVRASQMTQKTNQFNLTTLRCEIPDVIGYVERPDRALIVLDYADRFGSEGIVALAMLDLADSRITNFLMSCRVIGRRVENRLLQRTLDVLREHGAGKAVGTFVPTRKNGMVATFYESHGFNFVRKDADGSSVYELTIS
jgi:FkbH-like protein